jgi:hypothetical protein
VGRPHPIAMPPRAKHLGARVLGDRIVARQEHRPRWDDMLKQARDQGARQCPGRPAALGNHPMLGRPMPLHLISHGAEQVGHGASPRGPYGREPQDEQPVRGGRGQCGPNQAEYRHCPGWYVHGCGPSLGLAAAA